MADQERATPSVKDRRRYQVFISSTFDLQEERKAAVEAVFERGHIPIALERFSPANASDLEVITKAMKDCQVFILILGHRYGELIHRKDISFTEFEYNLAQQHRLKTLIFMLKPEVIDARRKRLSKRSARDRLEIGNDARLRKFHDRIKHQFKRIWTPGPEFKYVVELALADNENNWDMPGFVKEPKNSMIFEVARNEFIVDIVAQLKGFEKLYERCSKESEQKRQIAKFFVQEYTDLIHATNASLFFESGSTIAYVAKEMSELLRERVVIGENGAPNMDIKTNNVLAYLLFWLKARIPCSQFPWTPPVDETYGAAYGGLDKHLTRRDPDYTQPALDQAAMSEIAKLLATPFTLGTMKLPALLLGAASGLQMGTRLSLKFQDGVNEDQQRDLRLQLEKCLGPHVGSYHNKVFKRFLYATKLPIAIFVTGDKIDSQIEVGRCHFILDSTFTWEEFCRDYPVAFCVGCLSKDGQRFAEMFRGLGFKLKQQNSASSYSAFIARNAAFIGQFEEKYLGKATDVKATS